MYIVTGATGQTGSAVAKELLEKGLPVRVVVRSEEKGAAWKEAGAEVAVAGLQDAESLKKAFAGGKALYVMNPPDYQSADMFAETEKNIAAVREAIEASDFKKLVVLSSIGAHLPSGTGNIKTLHMIEEGFRDLGVPTVFLRPPNFMDNWLSEIDSAEKDGVVSSFLSALDEKTPHIATEDIGQIAAEALTEPGEGVEIREISGVMTSPNDVAEAFSKVFGRDVIAVAVPESEWRGIFSHFVSEGNIDAWVEMYTWMNSGEVDFETDRQIEGKTNFEEFLRRRLS